VFFSDKEPLDHLQQLREELQVLLHKHKKLFSDILPGIQIDRGFKHIIEVEEGLQAVITNPYLHPKVYKDEIEKKN